MGELEAQVQAILADWDGVCVQSRGPLWQISGQYRGVSHAGAREDALGLARDLDGIARALLPAPNSFEDLDLDMWRGEAVQPAVQTAEPGAQGEPATLEQLSASGTMLVEDEMAWRRAAAVAAIVEQADIRLAALQRPVLDDWAVRLEREAWQLRQHGLPLQSQHLDAEALNRDHVAAQKAYLERVQSIHAYSAGLRRAVSALPLNLLRTFDASAADWPREGGSACRTDGDPAQQ